MKLLVFQHIDCEHPGSLRTFLRNDGIEWHAINLHRGEQIPSLDKYDALWVMGGPMDVWDIEENPWLVQEKSAIRTWVRDLKKPYLGLCLGHQLLADALGGTCGPQKPAEIGMVDVRLTDQGKVDPLFKGLSAAQKFLQWHSVRVAQPPEDSIVLASSEICNIQALRVGKTAWSMQYHAEIEPDTVDNWASIPAYREALITTLGSDGLTKMKLSADAEINNSLKTAETLYRNFMATLS